MDRPRRSGGEEWRDAAIAVGLAAVALLGWLWLSGWEWRRLANPDPMSSLGVLLIAAVVGVACFIALGSATGGRCASCDATCRERAPGQAGNERGRHGPAS